MKNHNDKDLELVTKLLSAKVMFEALEQRKLGLLARQEGQLAWFYSVKDTDPSDEVKSAIISELDALLADSLKLRKDYEEFSEWTIEHLPERYQYKVIN